MKIWSNLLEDEKPEKIMKIVKKKTSAPKIVQITNLCVQSFLFIYRRDRQKD